MEQTHLSFVGGIYHVRDEDRDRLFACITADYPKPTFLVEKRKSLFPMLFDFDFHCRLGTEVNPERFIADVVRRHVFPVLAEMFPDTVVQDRRVVLCTNSPQLKERDVLRLCPTVSSGPPVDPFGGVGLGGGESADTERMQVQKTGMHLIFPRLFVHEKTALLVRLVLLERLEADTTLSAMLADDEFEYDKWANVCDETVLLSNGLRILGAHKAEKCPQASCRAKTDLGRPYSVYGVYGPDDVESATFYTVELVRLQLDRVYALQELSMRPLQPVETSFRCPDRVSLLLLTNTAEKRGKKNGGGGGAKKRGRPRVIPLRLGTTGGAAEDIGGEDGDDITVRFSDLVRNSWQSELQRRVEETFRRHNVHGEWWAAFGSGFQSLTVTGIHDLHASACLFTKTRYCVAAGRCHGRNRTFLLLRFVPRLKAYTLAPRCFSPSCRHRCKEMDELYQFVLPYAHMRDYIVMAAGANPTTNCRMYRFIDFSMPYFDTKYTSGAVGGGGVVEYENQLPFKCWECDTHPCNCPGEVRARLEDIFTRRSETSTLLVRTAVKK
jgi:hypothetical protein